MRKRNMCWMMIVVALALPAAAQEDATRDKFATKIFRIEHADVESLAEVLSVFRGRVESNPDLGVIAWTGPADRLAGVEAAIKSLDVAPVPEPNVELTVYFIMASKSGSSGASVPAALDGVATQLKDVFGYESVQLIETTAMRVRHGSEGKINGILPQRLADDREARYEFYFENLKVTEDEAGRSIRLDGLNAGVQVPTPLWWTEKRPLATCRPAFVPTSISARDRRR